MSKKFIFTDYKAQISASTRKRTPEGYLIADALIARTGIQEYQGFELPQNIGVKIDSNRVYRIYRSPKEVFDPAALQSFTQKPVTNEHPHDVGGLVDANTATQKLVGVSGSQAVKNGDQILIPITLYQASTINDVDQGKVGISAGYTADLKMVPGISPDGDPYDGEMINIRGNHIAICDVSAARGGQVCRILDDNKRVNMKQGLVQADQGMGGNDGVPDLSDINQIGQMIQTLANSIKEGFQSVIQAVRGDSTEDEPESEGSGDDPVVPLTDEGENINNQLPAGQGQVAKVAKGTSAMKATDTNTALVKMQQEIAYLRGQLQVSKKTVLTDSQVHKMVSERVKLIKEAEQILPGKDLAMLDSTKIKKLVLDQGMPGTVLDSTPKAFIDGAYQAYISTVLAGQNSAFGLASAINDSYASGGEGSNDAFADVDSGAMADKAFQDLQERRKAIFEGRKS